MSRYILGGVQPTTVTKTASYQATTSDYSIRVDASGGERSVTLPLASTCAGKIMHVKKVDASANAAVLLGCPQPTTLLDGILHYWKMDEASGTRYDSVGTNHLLVSGGSSSGPGVIGLAARLNYTAALGQMLYANDPDLNLNNIPGVTFAGWFYSPSDFTQPQRRLFSFGLPSWAGGTGYFGMSNGNAGPGWLASVAQDGPNTINGGVTFTPDAWHFFVYWYDPSTKKVYCQVDDGPVNESASALPNNPVTNGTYFEIGGEGYGYALVGSGQGAHDESGLWTRVLTAGERTTLFNSGAGNTHPFALRDVIDGYDTQRLLLQGEALMVQSNGVSWDVL